MLEQVQNLAKRKDFKPFTDLSVKRVVPPLRKYKRAVSEILAHSEQTPLKDRVYYAKNAGIKLEEGENEIEIKYTEDRSLELLALALFDIDEEEVTDFDNMNEGEVQAGLQFFFMKLKGI